MFAFWSILFCIHERSLSDYLFFLYCRNYDRKILEKKDEKAGNAFFTIFKNPVIYISMVAALFYLGYMKYIGGVTKWKAYGEEKSNFIWDNNGFNCFGFNLEYIYLKFQQMFIINYRWIITLLIVVSIILLIFFRKKIKLSINKSLLISILLSLLSYICFNCLYITFALVRYNYISDLLIILVLGMIISEVSKLKVKNIINGSLVVVCVIFCVESFITTDPISKTIYPLVPTNSISMIYPGYLEKDIYYGDNLVYNNQYFFFQKAIINF